MMAPFAVDNRAFVSTLQEGAAKLGIGLSPDHVEQLTQHQALLLRWGTRVNLTALREPRASAENHFLDSLVLLPEVSGAHSLLDLGSGAGFPGLPLKVLQP